jgi:PilZ domain
VSGRPPGPRAPRARVRLEAAYEDAERQVFVATGDLSESGAWLLAPDPPETGLPARLTLELPGVTELLRLRGLVVRRRSEAPAGFAVRFDPDSTSSRSRLVLRRFVEDSLAQREGE